MTLRVVLREEKLDQQCFFFRGVSTAAPQDTRAPQRSVWIESWLLYPYVMGANLFSAQPAGEEALNGGKLPAGAWH